MGKKQFIKIWDRPVYSAFSYAEKEKKSTWDQILDQEEEEEEENGIDYDTTGIGGGTGKNIDESMSDGIETDPDDPFTDEFFSSMGTPSLKKTINYDDDEEEDRSGPRRRGKRASASSISWAKNSLPLLSVAITFVATRIYKLADETTLDLSDSEEEKLTEAIALVIDHYSDTTQLSPLSNLGVTFAMVYGAKLTAMHLQHVAKRKEMELEIKKIEIQNEQLRLKIDSLEQKHAETYLKVEECFKKGFSANQTFATVGGNRNKILEIFSAIKERHESVDYPKTQSNL